ncbi:hypothetical protein [Sigmofec virus UA08Rod_5899]|uniref:Uncharacterized protein n=1 Tax=Sigmofec virus UA08Rod_5899 TaxID=2929445 RepID=A0A976N1J0_9VIRU|nr:hypothetical protein [Sigmofec virus UA08Rod_5899]
MLSVCSERSLKMYPLSPVDICPHYFEDIPAPECAHCPWAFDCGKE